MKTDMDIIAEQCEEIDRRRGDAEPEIKIIPPPRKPGFRCPYCGECFGIASKAFVAHLRRSSGPCAAASAIIFTKVQELIR